MMDRNLFKYIWRNSWRDQLAILAIVLISQVFYFISLDLPKQIVNNAIQGEAFKGKPTAPFLRLTLGPYDWLGLPKATLFDGFQLDRVNYLIALCCSFLFFVVLNGWLKQRVQTEKGRLGERMLRRLRYELFDRILRFPFSHFRKVKQAEIATMIKDEVEPLGGFIGDAFIQPAFLGGTALTALYFLFTQSVFLGGVTVAILAVQVVVIPRLRVKILLLGRERQITARQLAGRIAEVVDGAQEVHVHDTSNYERADIANRLGHIFKIRFDLYQRKFFVKYLNNMLAQTTPFLFYLIGGYLALMGRFDIGSLVAAIGAYKDLPSPIKELIDWDQQRQDVQIKYDQVTEQFSPTGMMDRARQDVGAEIDLPVAPIDLQHVGYIDESGARLLDDVTLTVAPDRSLVVIGHGKETLGFLLARFVEPTTGSMRIGSHDVKDLSEAALGRYFSYVGDEAYLFPHSIRENIIYGLKHRPGPVAGSNEEAKRHREWEIAEAMRAGNPVLDINADWVDYQAAGVADAAGLSMAITDLLSVAELDGDVYHFGLRGFIDPAERPELAQQFLLARQAIAEHLRQPGYKTLVEPFDPERYNKNLTLVENMLFGTPTSRTGFDYARLVESPFLTQLLDRQGLTNDLLRMGQHIAETMVELFADLPPGHPFFDQFSFIAADELPAYQQLVQRLDKGGLGEATLLDRRKLIGLTFPYIEARHRLNLIDTALEERLLKARRTVFETLPPELRPRIDFYDPERYNAAASVQDNLLFGRLVFGQAQAHAKIGKLISEVIDNLGLRAHVMQVGLDYHIGSGGKKLSTLQRQKVALLRALIKHPQVLVLNNAFALFDHATQQRLLDRILNYRKGKATVLMTDTASLAWSCEDAVIFKDGRVLEAGTVAELDQPDSLLRDLAGPPRQQRAEDEIGQSAPVPATA
ncbi:ABC transporter transmembrane domain-containing protein [Dongia soli]|uniref:ABC transporter transmembrane domain-containing protein n=1 Tax=Dongia soli TaxID=600628 RepID=A0ABU5E6U0_9PROT|nr:ABC transporter transmembrane domain-containing protein [Dongia soli]MDY0882028.1 ABC transporter transmembrane domain-containing protein [Dongia soli]